MKKLLSILLTLSMMLSLAACGGTPAEEPVADPAPETNTSEVTEEPSTPPAESSSAEENEQPEPEAIPEPVVYSGSGDNVLEIDPPEGPYFFHITGNSGAHNFAVKAYDSAGEYLELLVNTTEPYEGITLDGTLTTSLLEISAEDDWTIELLPAAYIPSYTSGDTITGNGDTVFYVSDIGKTADISGNSDAHHFAVRAISNYGYDLLVNETEPYSGKVKLDTDTFLFVVTAESDWAITLN